MEKSEKKSLLTDQRILGAILIILTITTLMAVSSTLYLMTIYLPKQEAFIAQNQEITNLKLIKNLNIDSEIAKANVASVSVPNYSQNTTKLVVAKAELQASAPQSLELSEIIENWSNAVPQVSCVFRMSEADFHQKGSGMLFEDNLGNLQIWTNKHVATWGKEGILPLNCTLTFLDNREYSIKPESINIEGEKDIDFASITIKGDEMAVKHLAAIALSSESLCKKEAALGEKIVVLGYPTIGAASGITATEGIISGIEYDHYVTSAKIDHGNSGGIAISLKNNCYLGAPTFVKSGNLESLARILKWQSYK